AARPPEGTLGGAIELPNQALVVDRYDGIERRFENRRLPRFALVGSIAVKQTAGLQILLTQRGDSRLKGGEVAEKPGRIAGVNLYERFPDGSCCGVEHCQRVITIGIGPFDQGCFTLCPIGCFARIIKPDQGVETGENIDEILPTLCRGPTR
ncbi:MAG TPA: hypothetical protein VG713_14185, partial [Pirellulales bacterium]|nr:hypothetical protein [Pirellulales bacterium]